MGTPTTAPARVSRARQSKVALNAVLLAFGLSAIAAASGDSTPSDTSQGDCAAVTVYYQVIDDEKHYVLGPDRCVTHNTPWQQQTAIQGEEFVEEENSGYGVGYGVIVKLPHPPPPESPE